MRRPLIRALAPVFVAGALWFAAPAAHAQTSPSVALRLVSQSVWNGPRRPLVLSFSATNNSTAAFGQLSAELILMTPARSRTTYELSLHSDPTSTLLANPFPQTGSLEPGQTRTFVLPQSLNLLTALNETVIYPMRIELRSQDSVIGTLRTPLIFLSEAPKVPLNVVSTWILWEPLQLRPDGALGPGPIETDITQGGRLDAMVSGIQLLGRGRADVVVSSVLLDELDQMARGYRAIDSTGSSRMVPKGEAGALDASRLLAGLQKIASRPGIELVSMPFGDPGIPSLVGAGLGKDVHPLTVRGNALARTLLHSSPAVEVARPLFSELDGGALTTLIRLGTRTVLLDPAYVPTPPGLRFSPPALARLSVGNRSVTALLPDTGAAAIATAYQADPVLDAHAVLGELAAIWLEFPGTRGRGAAVLFPEQPSMSPSFFESFAPALQGSPWLSTVPASELERIVGAGERQPLAAQTYPGFAFDYVRSLLDAKARLAAFRATAEGAKPLASRMEDLLLLSESSTFVTDPASGERFIDATQRTIRGIYRQVGVAGSSVPVTLTSRSGVLPLTLYNRAGFPMRVILRFVTDRRLVFANGSSQEILLPASSQTLTFRVRAQTTGRFPLTIQLLTPSPASGSPPDTIAETELIVRSTAYNLVALLVTIGAAVFLAIWWGRRFLPRPKH